MKPIYSLRNLRKSYNGHLVLDIDELDLQPNRIYSLVGPNGCGKSTLLLVLALLLEPNEGELFFQEETITWSKRNLKRLRQDITMVHQAPYLFNRSVRANLAYGLKVRGIQGQEQHRRIHDALDLVGLPGFGRRNARELSGGEMQRVAIARALVLDPKVLIMDEPTSSMDKKSIAAFDALIPTLKEKEMTVIQATHMADQPERLGSDVISMEQGKIVRK
ncbi:MAG: ATP-binding cassette domain-containing protein [Syntrophotaleaceae bacterium]